MNEKESLDNTQNKLITRSGWTGCVFVVIAWAHGADVSREYHNQEFLTGDASALLSDDQESTSTTHLALCPDSMDISPPNLSFLTSNMGK